MIGKTYLLRGEPVTVVARWRNPRECDMHAGLVCTSCGMLDPATPPDPDQDYGWCCSDPDYVWAPGRTRRGRPQAVRNVLLRMLDGSLTVRPFRGLRRPPAEREGRCLTP